MATMNKSPIIQAKSPGSGKEFMQEAGRVLLPEDAVLFWAGQRPPTPHARFQRAPDAGADLGVAPPYLVRTAVARMPGVAFKIGTISLSQTSASGSGRRRPRGASFWDGRRGLFSIR